MAGWLGGSVLNVIEHLAARKGTPIRCCSGSVATINAAMQSMLAAEACVIDGSALATMFVLNEVTRLQAMSVPCVVSSGTIADLKLYLGDLDKPSGKQKRLSKEEGRYVLIEVSPADEEAYRDRVRNLIEVVEKVCVIESGLALADIEVKLRNDLVELFGQAGAESVALARGRTRILWTDDWTLGATAATELGVSRVWTQAVTSGLRQQGRLEQIDADNVTLKLLVAGYSFTNVGQSVVLRAADQSKWNPDLEPLRSAIEHLKIPEIDAKRIWLLAGQCLARVWRSATADSAAESVARAIMNAVAQRPDGTVIISGLRSALDGFFGLDVVNARKASMVIADCQRGGASGLIVTP